MRDIYLKESVFFIFNNALKELYLTYKKFLALKNTKKYFIILFEDKYYESKKKKKEIGRKVSFRF